MLYYEIRLHYTLQLYFSCTNKMYKEPCGDFNQQVSIDEIISNKTNKKKTKLSEIKKAYKLNHSNNKFVKAELPSQTIQIKLSTFC